MDSFKGSLSSAEAEAAVAEGLRRVFPSAGIVTVPASDGGEGMTEAFIAATGGAVVSARVHDALMRPIEAEYGIVDDSSLLTGGRTAVIEVAAAAGLARLSLSERNPMLTTSFGVGEMIADALFRGCRRFVVGVGGSATNDAGLGMMEALGARFYASDGSALSPCGGNLSQIARIDLSGLRPELPSASFVVACDVRNPFCGPSGAACVFAPQKGASAEQTTTLDAGMRHVASLIQAISGIDLFSLPGTGAAGGLAGAFYGFLGAQLRPGVEVFTEISGLEEKIASSNLVITGEGKADSQTLMGKLPFGVLSLALRRHVPVVLVAGLVENHSELLSAGFSAVLQAAPSTQPLSISLLPSVARRNLTEVILMNHKILRGIAN